MASPASDGPEDVLTYIEIAHLIRRIDQRVLEAVYARLYISPELTYDDEGHVKTVTLSWNAFCQLAGPWLKDAPG